MSLLKQIYTARDSALKNRDTAALDTLRILCSEAKNKEIEKGGELTDDDVLSVIRTQVKQLKDALVDFENANREDLAEKNRFEIGILNTFLPAQMNDDALRKIVQETMATAADGMSFGQLMGAAMARVNGQADGSRVKAMLEQIINETG
ncbi:MAG: hypothetical protein COU35_01810 [Candidatus Magasanikbacteria bacterium CG10_big_fil_rev_8_21_14_0_10_47_10]|uniref:Glutamyl-tRNA amidotransferase n=1 Tax=Candidatus Magasanikbacteria bacterium CG10_big_fil_rev_8_21_14_0_10_47_10 TaxID=1974652 RepID=A0A2H0TR17_9BACT|nr:MAG: hypothetical protein COU35_01810 [Candidatus Magasanikbacteria bacterium CG10_big_fil_rev_8_21_14_0_10_47_10]